MQINVTPLMVAAMGGHLDVVQLLISYGVDINAREAVGSDVRMVVLKRRKRRMHMCVRVLCTDSRGTCAAVTWVQMAGKRWAVM